MEEKQSTLKHQVLYKNQRLNLPLLLLHNAMPQKKKHSNDERTAKCPVDGCDYEGLARSMHLHVLQTSGDDHGPHRDIPDHLSFDDLETVGTQRVEMNYPESREVDRTARQCPVCKQVFNGKHAVMIHIGQMEGKENHPEDMGDEIDPEELPVVELDEDRNIVNVVEGEVEMPSTRRRKEKEEEEDRIRNYIKKLREQGKDEEADIAEKELLG